MANNNDGKMTGNKGEWSELYAFLRLLSQGRVYAANEKVEKIDNVYYPILKIIREEQKGIIYDYCIEEDTVVVEIQSRRIAIIDRKTLGEEADKLLEEIALHSGSFEVEEVASFVNGIKVTKIKAPSTDTTDISMQIQDVYTNLIRNVGFSIKSEVGNAPTLLNAGKTTNFIYRVEGISSEQAKEINAIETRTKIQDRMAKIREYGGILSYVDMVHKGFKRNLIMVDSSMPEISAKPWDGLDEANGGYIIVKADGEVLAYHIYNRNFFEQYLLDNTICERASTGRHEYMSLYEEDGQMYIKLNLQVRFK